MFKIFGSKIAKAVATTQASQIQNVAKASFEQSLKGLEGFVAKDMSGAIASQKSAMQGLEQLSKNVQSMLGK